MLILVVVCGGMLIGHAEERIWFKAEINQKPVHLLFDTGASNLILFHHAAQRLGLRVTEPSPSIVPGPGEVVGGLTEECTLVIYHTSIRTRFAVIQTPDYVRMDEDGVLGWETIHENIIRIDVGSRTIAFLPNVPEEVAAWTKLRVRAGPTLCLELAPVRSTTGILVIDTGSPDGVELHPSIWREWKAIHTNQPVTLDAYYMPGAGLQVKEQAWAKELPLDSLRLSDVPIMEANATEITMGFPGFQASLGLAGLQRLDFIVDGKHGMAYLRPKRTPPPPFEHNRLGAAFVPPDPQSDDLVATVVAGSPAAEAGIRNGDILLKVGELTVSNWRRDPAILPLSRFWAQPPGTRLELTVKRGTETLRITAVLRQILSPNAKPPASHAPKNDPSE